ncbi:MAG: ATP-dependent helicase HrpB, partial [Candidatus Electrothrix sp. AR4]|nr:ATP-dependent helicase HrpB [Candidatus Electrothrix sp. AR4]
RVSRQLADLLKKRPGKRDSPLSIGGLLALAWPDRVAVRRSARGKYKLASGRGGYLQLHDPLSASKWLVVPSLDAGRQDGKIFLAASIEQEEVLELLQKDLAEQDEVLWDSRAQRVISRSSVRLGALLISERPLAAPNPTAVQAALLNGIRELSLRVLNWTVAARLLQARLTCLRAWQPEADWPDITDATLLAELEDWLPPYLTGVHTIKECTELNLEKILLTRLNFRQQQRLERDAPTHLQVPSGSRVRLEYRNGEPPVLAVRLQELFGLAETPTVCQGRVQVLLHLLSPARRPVQITQDLRGFWDNSYFEVRKELKGRYPKHHWPEKPWLAVATARVKRRK